MDAQQRRSQNHPCEACARCRGIVLAVAHVRSVIARSPSYAEINTHLATLGLAFRSLSSLEYHIRALLAQGFLARNARYFGLMVSRIPGEAAHGSVSDLRGSV